MKLTVLVDNNVYIDHYYLGEPALSFWIEDGDEKILFDTGYSNCFIENAEKLKIDLSQVSTLALSHGHNDHTGGLPFFNQYLKTTKPKLVAHPQAFFPKQAVEGSIGSPLSLAELADNYQLQLSTAPVQLSENILFLGEIPQLVDFEPRQQVGEYQAAEAYQPDYVFDDSALVFTGKAGLYIITGCSHSGICNICEYAKQVTGQTKIAGVIGGFHLFEENTQLQATINYFKENQIEILYPCHCVSFFAKSAIHQEIAIGEVGVGLTLEWQ
ncbi:7,8-dihydropterin-6-yl-methyl-4-(beta-D-ribofuranosyl)aminobenzene 5'-phosphate synthase [Enterococcus sp. PF1-24]|uniref:MBL fold metallo-hydrolase n=1 Tax=unclassified Enterococcus TaxID=2608891 RepID=UPI002474C979|nr:MULTISPECIES: MBL fold metallo-hydrolase [unclassified Enterococcus]MDH6363591.1 7,8-dihydropterin-6-yl-methyl-4-(beta-D-ribofuranosyl)aminobenzene 5'-phosphate synthase [Enterococcus sp. PFB1-1]MDH6400826.1 7,8-dihydropterin-6-yl-methyl-4-(beta-D-ribofuranosyl)aminobenzene 5'-phosphate synthase [Enterococcus sp. PF1-24]